MSARQFGAWMAYRSVLPFARERERRADIRAASIAHAICTALFATRGARLNMTLEDFIPRTEPVGAGGRAGAPRPRRQPLTDPDEWSTVKRQAAASLTPLGQVAG